MKNTLTVEVQNTLDAFPLACTEAQMTDWAQAAFECANEKQKQNPLMTIRIVSAEESQQLNHQYRQKKSPTNVLSFPMGDLPEEIEQTILGDIVICANIVEQEAVDQEKPEAHHWAHMVVHGVLHLLGFDHEENTAAETMEALEAEILAKFAIPNPYLS